MPERVPTIDEIEDRVIARARNRRRPLMPDDETVIRVICADFVKRLRDDGNWPPPESDGGVDFVVETLVACIGGLEFELGKRGGFSLRLVAPDDGMYHGVVDVSVREGTATSRVAMGQVWARRDGSRVRVAGFSVDGWVRVREIGGARERGSYPPSCFTNGAFTREERTS